MLWLSGFAVGPTVPARRWPRWPTWAWWWAHGRQTARCSVKRPLRQRLPFLLHLVHIRRHCRIRHAHERLKVLHAPLPCVFGIVDGPAHEVLKSGLLNPLLYPGGVGSLMTPISKQYMASSLSVPITPTALQPCLIFPGSPRLLEFVICKEYPEFSPECKD